MFRLIRANRRETITVSDLMANCDVAKTTAREYLAMMVKRGILRAIKPAAVNLPYRYQMIDDPGPNLIRNEEKTEKQRLLREAKALAKRRSPAPVKAWTRPLLPWPPSRRNDADIDISTSRGRAGGCNQNGRLF